jgi:hypothetical protein
MHLNRTYSRLAGALFVLVAVLVLVTFQDYGVTWDARFNRANGEYAVAYYSALFTGRGVDRDAFPWGPTLPGGRTLYGALFDGMGALLSHVSPLGTYETLHLLNGLVGLLGIVASYKIGTLIVGPAGGFWAGLLLSLTPPFYGHMFNNPKDIPFAVGYTWGLYYVLRAIKSLPAPSWGLMVKLGIALGAALGVRVPAVVLLAYLGVAIVGHLLSTQRRAPSLQRLVRDVRHLLVWSLGSTAIAYVLMLCAWPQAHADPLRHPVEVLARLQGFYFLLPVLFRGTVTMATELPWYFLPFNLLIKLPEPVTLLCILGVGVIVWRCCALARGRATTGMLDARLAGWLVACTLFPIVYAVVRGAILYDGVRQFLFVLPSICSIAGIGLALFLHELAHRRRWIQTATTLLLALYACDHLYTLVRLHPNQYVYYNHLVGGLRGAYRYYETDYWANSYAEAARRLAAIVATEEARQPRGEPYRVKMFGPAWSAYYYFPPYLVPTENERAADFVIAFTRENSHEKASGRVLLEVRRLGVPLSVVKDRRHLR